jgi:hypothetical protein
MLRMTCPPRARRSDTRHGRLSLSRSHGRPEHYSHDPRGRVDESPLPSRAAKRLRCAAKRIATRAHVAAERCSSSGCRFLPIASNRNFRPSRRRTRTRAGVMGGRTARSPHQGPSDPAAVCRPRRGLSTPPRSVDPTSRQAIQQSRRTSSLTMRPRQGQPTPRALIDSVIINYAMHDAEALYSIHRRF